jgi:methyltransferase (TIGR00027 family)
VQSGTPSRTALAAATHRAAHQVLEKGCIFNDPLALPILGDGLDTYAYRSTLRDQLRIFEVDHPATQYWKRQRLEHAAIPIPSSLTFAPIDFERQTLAEGLTIAGFDPSRQTFFTWLGVVPYLTEEAVWSTLRFIANLPNGAQVVFDYSNPPGSLSGEARVSHEMRATHVAQLGETWLNYFEADELRAKLMALGFCAVEDLGPSQIAARYFPNGLNALPDKGGHILRATTI